VAHSVTHALWQALLLSTWLLRETPVYARSKEDIANKNKKQSKKTTKQQDKKNRSIQKGQRKDVDGKRRAKNRD
jgi:hypothetical protein